MSERASDRQRQVIVEPHADVATEVVARVFTTILCDAVARRGECFMALAGGTTPHALYQRLAGEPAIAELPWSDVHVFFGDERDVPQDDIESNYAMAQRTLLDHVPIQPGCIHPMPADTEDIDAAARQAEQTLRDTVTAETDGVPRFDLILLGMGGDGHTASLFPGTEVLGETKRLIVGYHVAVLGRNRMTFTLPLINAARNVILLVTGSDKAEAVAGLLGDNPDAAGRIPAAGVAPTDGKLFVVLDADAARLTDLAR